MRAIVLLLIGYILGVGTGMLFSKRSGEDLRKKLKASKTPIKDLVNEGKTGLSGAAAAVTSNKVVGNILNEAKDLGAKAVDVAKDLGESAIEKAKETAKEMAEDVKEEVKEKLTGGGK